CSMSGPAGLPLVASQSRHAVSSPFVRTDLPSGPKVNGPKGANCTTRGLPVATSHTPTPYALCIRTDFPSGLNVPPVSSPTYPRRPTTFGPSANSVPRRLPDGTSQSCAFQFRGSFGANASGRPKPIPIVLPVPGGLNLDLATHRAREQSATVKRG